jgi:hypothetical protein
VSLTIRVPGAVGDVMGTVCEGDQFEVLVCKYVSVGGPPVGVAGVKVILLDPNNENATYAETTTDAQGNFVFHNVPVGTRFFRFQAPAGWHMVSGPHYQTEVIQGADPTKNTLMAGAHRD